MHAEPVLSWTRADEPVILIYFAEHACMSCQYSCVNVLSNSGAVSSLMLLSVLG